MPSLWRGYFNLMRAHRSKILLFIAVCYVDMFWDAGSLNMLWRLAVVHCHWFPTLFHTLQGRLPTVSIIYKVRWQTRQSNCCSSILPPSNTSEAESYFQGGCLGPHKSGLAASSASPLTQHLPCLKRLRIFLPDCGKSKLRSTVSFRKQSFEVLLLGIYFPFFLLCIGYV